MNDLTTYAKQLPGNKQKLNITKEKPMNELEQKTITSMEVAEMVEKEHSKLLRDIRIYCDQLNESKIGLVDFFTESTYLDAKGETRPCYQVTKKGCEFIGNKITGTKGAEFTAKYINRFHEMEEVIQVVPQNLLFLQGMLDQMVRQEVGIKEAKENSQKALDQVASIREVVALNSVDWRRESAVLINKMALICGGYEYIRPIREESYKLLEKRYGVQLGIRLTNKKKTMALNGVCKSKLDRLNQLDVIAEDKKLVEGYTQIIKEMAIKYKAA